MLENKFPGKDISDEDIKSKFPLVAKIQITSQNLKFKVLNLAERKFNFCRSKYG